MFKLVVLSAILALSAGKPSAPWALSSPALVSQPIVSTYSVPSIANVGTVVSHVPTAVSSHSSSVVHSTGSIVSPILTPVQKTIIAAPLHAPALRLVSHASPLALSSLSLGGLSAWNQPIVQSW